MTTRNFRVNNGLSVGDVVVNASNNKITGLSTSAPSADGDVATKKIEVTHYKIWRKRDEEEMS